MLAQQSGLSHCSPFSIDHPWNRWKVRVHLGLANGVTAKSPACQLRSSSLKGNPTPLPRGERGEGARPAFPPPPPVKKKPKLAPSLQTQQFTTGNPNSPSEGGREGGPRPCLLLLFWYVSLYRNSWESRAAIGSKRADKGSTGERPDNSNPRPGGGGWPAGRRATVDVHQAIGGGRVEQRRRQMPPGASGGSAYVLMFTVGFQVVRDCVFTDRVEMCLSPVCLCAFPLPVGICNLITCNL